VFNALLKLKWALKKVLESTSSGPMIRITLGQSMRRVRKKRCERFREYFAGSYESQKQIAARVGMTETTFSDLLKGDRQPKPTRWGNSGVSRC
jgi:hypothetical protein